jgi:hypothetical protein
MTQEYTNAKNTLVTIKRYIYGEAKAGRTVSDQMEAALIVQAHACYKAMGVKNPGASAISYVSSTVQNSKRR